MRTVWDDQEEKWYFSIVDVCGVLTDSKDALTARKYWKKLKQRLKNEGNETVTNCYQLKLRAADCKMRLTDVADTEQLFRPNKTYRPHHHLLDGTKEYRNMSRKAIHQLLDVLKEYQSLGIAEQIDYDKFYLYSIITHSTAIEGSTVTEIENQLLFDEGITAKGRTLQEQMMNLDLKAAYEKSRVLATHHVPITIDLLKSLAAIVMKNTGSTYKTVLGDFSSANGDLRLLNVRAGTEGKSYLNFQKVPARLKEFCEWLNEERSKVERGNVIDAYALSFDAHFRLVTIHPWADGNGRMSRLLMNHLQFEYQLIPTKVMKEQKAEYIQSLVDAREQDDISVFRRVMFDLHIRNLQQEIEQFRESMEQDVIGDKQKNVTDVTDRQHAIINLVKEHTNITTTQMAERLGVTKRTILRDIEALKKKGLIIRVGSEKAGYWELK